MAASDIAFILIVFFLVCASVQPDTGRSQTIPRVEPDTENQPRSKTIEVSVTKGAVVLNGQIVNVDSIPEEIRSLLRGLERPEDRIVLVKSSPDTPYERWIDVTSAIGESGGIATLQMEENSTITID